MNPYCVSVFFSLCFPFTRYLINKKWKLFQFSESILLLQGLRTKKRKTRYSVTANQVINGKYQMYISSQNECY